MCYEIVNAQKMARTHPDTFQAPSLEDLDLIKPKDNVKICVIENGTGERFWVEVTQRDHVYITGIINNNLVFTESMKCDDEIKFKLTDVYDILTAC